MTAYASLVLTSLDDAMADPELRRHAQGALTTAAAAKGLLRDCGLCHVAWDLGHDRRPWALLVARSHDELPSITLLCRGCAALGQDQVGMDLMGAFLQLLHDKLEAGHE